MSAERLQVVLGVAAQTVPAQSGLGQRFTESAAAAGLTRCVGDDAVVTSQQIAHLPPAVRRYLHFMGVVGKPRVWSFRVQFGGRFRLRRALGWMPAEAWQYNCADPVGRIFAMRIRVAGVLPMNGLDTYLGGHGRMTGTLLGGRVTVADGKGPEFDIGELTTYLNDALLLAPSMLLTPRTTWTEVDSHSFDVTLNDAGRGVTGRVFIDDNGAPVDFSTTDRFAALPTGLVRAEWRTPLQDWQSEGGRVLPGRVSAMWRLPDRDMTYVEGAFIASSLQLNRAP